MNRATCCFTLIALCVAAIDQACSAGVDGPGTQLPGPGVLPADLKALLAAEQSPWSTSATLSVASGYKDNLLYSHIDPEQSWFTRLGAEAFAWHVPVGLLDYYAFANADWSHYFEGRQIKDESQAFVGGEVRIRVPKQFEFSVGAQGYYLDQVLDISDTFVARTVAELQVKGIRGGPKLRWNFASWLWMEAGGAMSKEVYPGGSNDSRAREGEARMGLAPRDEIEFSLAFRERRREFKHRNRYDEFGFVVDGLLATTEREREARLRFPLGRRWRTEFSGVRGDYRDNGVGFLDYRVNELGLDIEWSDEKWLVGLEGKARRKDYRLQQVGIGTDVALLEKDEYTGSLRIERRLSKRWTLYLVYAWEVADTNGWRAADRLPAYDMNEGLLGLRWSWEE